ncbi:hypothetical protein ABZ352_35635 [Streptomyces griseofuscus]|uniref:hypothetical protein n=1 Tax=Streptomyces griseofuscus TaxID=146922 RepID=UPI0033E31FC4
MDRHDPNSVRIDASNVVITAREAVPGTVVVVEGWESFATVTVQRWEPADDGYATLYGADGVARGRFREGDYLEADPKSLSR